MKGLMQISFYGAIGGGIVLLALFAALGTAALLARSFPLLLLFGIGCMTVFACNALAGLRKESASNWRKYAITAPIRRKDIVKSQYLTHLLWLAAGFVVTAIFVGLTLAIHGVSMLENGARDLLSLFCVGAGIPLLIGAIFYPAIYLLGTERSEITLLLSLLGATGITFGALWLLNLFFGFRPLIDLQYLAGMLAYTALAIALFALSYVGCKFLNGRKEY